MFTVGGNSSGAAPSPTPAPLPQARSSAAPWDSNVDLGHEFIGLIAAETGYSAATRVISTTDDMFQQLLALGR